MRHLRSFVPIVVLAGASLGLAVLITIYGIGRLAPRSPQLPARTIPHTDVNPYGANFFLHEEVEEWKRDKTVRLAQAAGIGWAKQQFPWSDIEPLAKGEYLLPGSRTDSWRKYDQLVDLYRRYGIQVIARLDRAPEWARPPGTRKEHPPADLEDFGDFVYAFVDHFRGRVGYIQIWNEPNIYPEWGDQPVNPVAYVEMLKIAYRRAKEADPNIVVLSAPLAITLEDFPERRNLNDLVFLEEMYRAGAREYFDILSANAFGMDHPPEAPADRKTLNFARVLLQRDIMARYGDTNKPIWFNEYGWNAAPATFPQERLIWKRVTEEQQARYTVAGIEMARRAWPWAGVFNIWYFRQVGHIGPDDPAYYFRMVDVDFTPRPVYYAVQSAAEKIKVAGAGRIEERNPAVTWNVGWQPVLDARASGGAYAMNASTTANMTVRFRGESVRLIARGSSTNCRLHVRLDGRPVPGLPSDEARQTYVELMGESNPVEMVIPIADALSDAPHTLELSLNGDAATSPRCHIDAFEIMPSSGPAFPLVPVAILGVLIIGASATITLDRRFRPRRGVPGTTLYGFFLTLIVLSWHSNGKLRP